MTDTEVKKIEMLYAEAVSGAPEKNIQRKIESSLKRCGIMYRIFSRIKEKESIIEKLTLKKEKYEKEGSKLQDIIGLRIILYFKDDIDICIRILNELFEVDNFEYDAQDTETFKPKRINYVFKIPSEFWSVSKDVSDECRIDNTFEVQIRTTFSEGWHEVEHDIRYKFKEDWEGAEILSREMNGIMAVLEVCDNNILSVCEKMAYKKYKEREWESMIRNKFRLRILHEGLDPEIVRILNENLDVAKEIFRFERLKLIEFLAQSRIPLNCNNIVYVLNELELNNLELHEKASDALIEKCKRYKDLQKDVIPK